MGAMNLFVAQAAAAYATHVEACDGIEARAFEKWEKSKSLPRKQKKLMRKDAILDYSIAQWGKEPFYS